MNKLLQRIIFSIFVPSIPACVAAVQPGDPLWKISFASKKACRALDGKYQDKGDLYLSFMDSPVHPIDKRFSTVRGIVKIPDTPLTSDELRSMNAVSSRQIIAAQRKNSAEQRRIFDESAVTEIRKNGEELEILLRGGDGKTYAMINITTSHENVGCDADGRLVLRQFVVHQGSPGVRGSAWAIETSFARKNDLLKVQKLSREWTATMKNPPTKETKYSLEFPFAR